MMRDVFLIAVLLYHLHQFQTTKAGPCDVTSGFSALKSARIEFDEDAKENTSLFSLPFEGKWPSQIEDITFRSNDLDESKLSEYFRVDPRQKRLILKSHYDLDTIQLDLIELVFTCTVRSVSSQNATTLAGPSFGSLMMNYEPGVKNGKFSFSRI